MYQWVMPKFFIYGGLFVSLLFLTVIVGGHTAHAQSAADQNIGVHLVTNPQFPSPNTPIEVSLDAYSLETTGATISWYVNDVPLERFENERTITIETGDIGEKTKVRVVLTRTNAPTLSSSITLIPSVIDVVLESSTYVPTFYKGRALPSSESKLRFIAVINDGTHVSESAYTYTWSLGSTVLLGGPMKGKYILDLDMPHFADVPLFVEVVNPEGEVIGKRSVFLTTTNPELHFYEHSPLRGLSQKELADPLTLVGEETTIHGEPYYINAGIRESEADFTWKINGEPTTPDDGIPNAITLRHIGGEGDARINFRVLSKGRIPQYVEKAFQLFFN